MLHLFIVPQLLGFSYMFICSVVSCGVIILVHVKEVQYVPASPHKCGGVGNREDGKPFPVLKVVSISVSHFTMIWAYECTV